MSIYSLFLVLPPTPIPISSFSLLLRNTTTKWNADHANKKDVLLVSACFLALYAAGASSLQFLHDPLPPAEISPSDLIYLDPKGVSA